MKKVIRALVVVVICLLVGAIVYLESSSFRHIVSNIPLISSTLDSAYKKLEIHTLANHEMVTDAAGNSVYKEYYYGTLNEKQQKFYDEIKDDVQSLNLSSFHYVSGFDTDAEDVQLAIEALSKDYPEYFFIDNNESQLKYGGFKEHIKYYTIEYKDDKEEALKQYHEIDSMAKQITSEVEYV